MLTLDSALVTYFASGAPIVEETYVWILGRNASTGTLEAFGFWTGSKTQSFTVFDPQLGATTSRSYMGDAIRTVPIIVGTPTLSTQNAITFEFEAAISLVQTHIRGKNLRRARVEVHKGYYNPQTNALIAAPYLAYVGIVDEGEQDDPAADQNGEAVDPPVIALSFIPFTRGIKRNTKTRALEVSKSRSGDKFYKFTNVAAGWRIWWGRRKKSHKDRDGKNKNNKTGKGDGGKSFEHYSHS